MQDEGEALEGIAIIGMSGRFAGAAHPTDFWRMLREGKEGITLLGDEELLKAGCDPDEIRQPNYVRARAILKEIEYFDASFFNIPPNEAELMDPQQRFFLECAWEALEDAAYDPDAFGGWTGVFAGCSNNDYWSDHTRPYCKERPFLFFNAGLASLRDFLATRVSYKLNLKGPSVNVQTACSTSLVAVHLACQSLVAYQCDMALAGGVSIKVPQESGYLYQEGSIYSPDGHCRPFDAGARGTVFGSGVGVVVLRRLADAVKDGDYIYAVIKGSAVNNDGSVKVGFTAPGVEGQKNVIALAQAMADVKPETITYIETHGTGTELGDPVEIEALTKAFRMQTDKKQFCAIGSVKANIGHNDAAAGVANLIKTALALTHKEVPPSINFQTPNPKIDFDGSPFYVNTRLRDWKTPAGQPRRAGVSSFGIGGTNAHLILEEAPAVTRSDPVRREQLLVLSAKSGEALQKMRVNLAAYLRTHPEIPLADVAYTLQVGRRAFEHRLAFVCGNSVDAARALESDNPGLAQPVHEPARQRPLYFLFPGQGSQYVHMGKGLYESEKSFRAEVDRCTEILKPYLGLDLRSILYPTAGAEAAGRAQLEQTRLAQPALFVIEYALAKLWMAWGLKPEGLIGHSIGEYVAACLAGIFTLEQALALVAQRGRLMQSLPGGSMLALFTAEAEIRPYIRGALSLAAVNGPRFCTVSGPDQAIAELEIQVKRQNISCRRLHTSHAFHSVMMEPILNAFHAEVQKISPQAPAIRLISNVSGTWMTAAEATDPQYWTRHLRQTVRFADGLAALLKEPDAIFLEVGPGNTLSTFAKQQQARAAVNSLPHPEEKPGDRDFLLNALGRLWLFGLKPNWQSFYGAEQRRRIPLPVYPFERQKYWIEPAARQNREKQRVVLQKQSDVDQWFYTPYWKPAAIPSAANQPQAWLLFGADPEWGKRLRMSGHTVHQVHAGLRFNRLDPNIYSLNPGQAADYDKLLTAMDATVKHLVWFVDETFDFQGLVCLAQALARHNRTLGYLDIVTCRAQAVFPTDQIHARQALTLGPVLVLPQEYPGLICRSLDLDEPGPADQYDHLSAELTAAPAEGAVAYRSARRWVQHYESIRPETSNAGRLRRKGVYLLIGGFGQIGRILSRYLAETYQARLVITGRSGLPPRKEWKDRLLKHDPADPIAERIRFVEFLEAQGAEILVLAADAADQERMQAVLMEIRKRFGTLHGVLHMAVDRESIVPMPDLTGAAIMGQFRPKVMGAEVLAKILARAELDFCMLFSSLAGVLGGLGFTVYAAVNRFMDAWAHQQNRTSRFPWFSVNWDTWRSDKNSSENAFLKNSGAADFAMQPEEGIRAFMRVLGLQGITQVVVSTGDLQARLDRWVRPGVLSDKTTKKPSPHPYARPTLKNTYVAPTGEVEQKLAELWQELLGLEQVGVHDHFFELGGHSLLATQVISQIRQIFQINLPMRTFFETATIAGIAQFIDNACWLRQKDSACSTESGQETGKI